MQDHKEEEEKQSHIQKKPETTTNEDVPSEPVRTIIKLNPSDKESNADTLKEKQNMKNTDDTPQTTGDEKTLKKDLEQKKDYLKNIKEFSFRINENKEQIQQLTDKVNTIVGDLDDLVSLYEIVSEQMNPFVGLSRVTKKRIEALEHFSDDIEDLKTKMMQLESDFDTISNTKELPTKITKNIPLLKENKEKEDQLLVKIPHHTQTNDISEAEIDLILEETLNTITMSHSIEDEITHFLDKL